MQSTKLSHTDRYERRKVIARAIKDGDSIATVIRRHKVSIETIRRACTENGVLMPVIDSTGAASR